jgi:energy-coupling factor transport system permease protein
VSRLRSARRLRGRPDRGLRSLRGLAVPVLEGALERSVDLAAAIDARGFGRRAATSRRLRLTVALCVLTGTTAAAASSYALVDSTAPPVLGLPLLIAGAALVAIGFVAGARRGGRTRYRPNPWAWPEWLVVGAGVATAVALTLAPISAVFPSTSPPRLPAMPLTALIAVAFAVLPAFLAPPLPSSTGRRTTSMPPLLDPAVATR